MEKKPVDTPHLLNPDISIQSARWTRDIIALMTAVIMTAVALISLGIWIGIFTFAETIPAYIVLALTLPAWWATRQGRWRWMGFFPVLLCLGLGIYGTVVSGRSSLSVVFYYLAVTLAALLRDTRLGFATAGLSIIFHIALGGIVDGFGLEWVSNYVMFSSTIFGIALVQWYTVKHYRQLLSLQAQVNESLQAEADRRRETERLLGDQENQLRRMAENTSDLIAEIGPDGTFRYASPAYRPLLGYEPDQLIGTNSFDLLHPDDLVRVASVAKRAAAAHAPDRAQARSKHADGRWVDVEISGKPLYDENGEHAGFVIVSRDISDRVLAEKQAQESEERFRHIVESLPLGIHIYRLDADDRLIFSGFNPSANRILGIEHQQKIGLTIEEAFPGLRLGEIPKTYRELAQSGGSYDKDEIIYSDEQLVGAYQVHAFQIYSGTMVTVFSDITERRKAEEAIRLSEEKFSTAFQISPDSININRLEDGMYLDINQGFTQLMGYDREDVLGRTSTDLNIWVNPADRARLVKGLLERGVVENLEARFRRKSGDIGIGLMSARVIVIQGEKCILSITRDITGRIQAELDLREAHTRLEQAYEATLLGWAHALELRERETANHSQRVVDQTLQIAQALGIQDRDLANIQRGALLHDIGKMGVPDSILLKPGPLTPDEWVSMRQHVEFAYSMLCGIEYLHASMDIPYCHHEKWDGTGYPRGLKGEAIPVSARIFAVVDVYDALTHDRPYRPAWSVTEARHYLYDMSGKHFDPQIVDLFLKVVCTD